MSSTWRMPQSREHRRSRRKPSGYRADNAHFEKPGTVVKVRDSARRTAESIQREMAREDAQDAWSGGRGDGWRNSITRLGDYIHDKRLHGHHLSDRLPDLEAEDIWRGDPMAARAVEEIPNQILRAGMDVQVQQEPEEGKKDAAQRRRQDRIRWMKSEAGRRWWNKRIDWLQVPKEYREPHKLREQLRLRIKEDLASEVFPDDAGQDASDESKEIQDAISEDMKRLEVMETFTRAMKCERGYGGAAVFPIIRDGEKDLSKPLDHDRIQSIDGLDWLIPLELVPFQWYADPTDLYFGRPQLYWMQRISIGNIGATARVPIHESRLITFPGIVTSRRQLREHWGWGDSIFVRMKEALRDFQAAHQGAAMLVEEYSIVYMKLKGLVQAFASNDDTLLTRRATALKEGMSIARAMLLDVDEEMGRLTAQTTGLPELLDRMASWLAATVNMPITILMGQAPAGLNATGAMDIRAWYDSIDRQRKQELCSRLDKFFRMLFFSQEGPTGGSLPDKWTYKWGHLWQPSEQEQAQARYLVAQADNIYLQAGVLMPEEVAKSRFGGAEYSPEIQLDPGIRETHDDQVEEEAQREQEMHEAKVKQLTTPKPAPVIAGGAQPKPAPKGDVADPDDDEEEPEDDAATELAEVPDPAVAKETPPKGKARMPPIPPEQPEPTAPYVKGKKPARTFRKPKSGAQEAAEDLRRVVAGEQRIPTTGDYMKGAGGKEPPPQPPVKARYKTPRDTSYKIPGPEVPVGKYQGPQSV